MSALRSAPFHQAWRMAHQVAQFWVQQSTLLRVLPAVSDLQRVAQVACVPNVQYRVPLLR